MNQHLNDLQEIRKIMEKSSRFLSLSGLSGVSAGAIALIASAIAWFSRPDKGDYIHQRGVHHMANLYGDYIHFLIKLGVITLVLAIISGLYFTWKKAGGIKEKMWNASSKKLVVNLSIPLLAGGFVVIFLLQNHVFWIIPELMLIFYGLALVNASQNTYRDVFYLGLSELVLGIIALFINGYSLFFWAFGFGVLHIVYGIAMHMKYERKK